MHMQLPDNASQGVKVPGYWEMAVPNGAYSVQVAVGDAGTASTARTGSTSRTRTRSRRSSRPSPGRKYSRRPPAWSPSPTDASRSALSAAPTPRSPTSTSPASPGGRRPAVAQSTRPTGTGIALVHQRLADRDLLGSAVNPTTVHNGAVTLTEVSDGAAVAGVGTTSGGGDTSTSARRGAAAEHALPLRRHLERDRHHAATSSCRTPRCSPPGSTNPGTGRPAFDKTDSGAAKGKAYTSLAFRARRQALRRHDLRPDLPLRRRRRRHAEQHVRDQHGAHARLRRRLGRRPRPHRHRPGLRPGVDAHQPDPVDHRQLRLPGLRRARQHRCGSPG